MDRVVRFIVICALVFLAFQYGPKLMNGDKGTPQPIGHGVTESAVYGFQGPPGEKCTVSGNHFRAEISTRGAALVDYFLTGDERYTDGGKPIELTTVPGSAPDRFALHFDWRALGTVGANAQTASDVVDWKILRHDEKSCTFEYVSDDVALTKTVRAGEGPYEVLAEATIRNKSTGKRVHRLGIENAAWRSHKETDSSLGRQSPFATEVSCGHDSGKLERKGLSDFAPKDFEKPEFERGFWINHASIDFAATTNAYFAQALVPLTGGTPVCGLQVEERWYREQFPDKTKDPNYGAMYRSRLIYPARELAQDESASYEVLAYFGPKDRAVLATAAHGSHFLSELIDLGKFAIISKVLVAFLGQVHGVVGNWGLAIILLTLCVRLVMFPLTWKQIKSTISMRRLKPEIDRINALYPSDPQQKQIATMEMYRKNGVNPLGGCLPAVVQMPVWWALYSTLQTAVELYHTPFLWLRDLSGPDPYFLLPIVIGCASFVQQKMMPQQLDAAQQRMMQYFFPALFTVMMLFLPSGLGIYMLTNSILGIVQQRAVEKFAPSKPSGGISVREKTSDEDGNSSGPRGQGRKVAGTLPAKLKG